MFANSHQSGFVSIFYSVGSNPLQIWDKQVKNGHIRRLVDDEVKSLVLEVAGTNVATTFITCPQNPKQSLGIKLPFLVMIIKNTRKYFSFEIQIKDDKDMHRRFRVSNFQSTTKVYPFCTTMPIGLSAGWNQVQFNLADFTKRAYGSTYLETTRVQIHANVRIRRIYFSDMLYSEEEMPNEYKLYKPAPGAGGKKQSADEAKAKQQKQAAPGEGAEIPPPPSPVEQTVQEEQAELQKEPAAEEGGEQPEAGAQDTEAPAAEEPAEGGGEEAPPSSEAPAEAAEAPEDAPPAEEAAGGEEAEAAAPAEEAEAAPAPAEEPPAEPAPAPEEAPAETAEEPPPPAEEAEAPPPE